jgi:transcriptional regulator EpsA
MRPPALVSDSNSCVAGSLLSLAWRCTELRSKAELQHWLGREVQPLIPHAFMAVAWGDMHSEHVTCDLFPAHTTLAPIRDLGARLRDMFARWQASNGGPITLAARDTVPASRAIAWPSVASHVLAHGVTDGRGAYDRLYAFFGSEALCDASVAEASRVLLPFIDAGFRQLTFTLDPDDSPEALVAYSIPGAHPAPAGRPPADSEHELSARELEVMKWVRMGKTNPEIACILDLSTFTVKNHMRRIYRKLDVMNRAQAVGCMQRLDAPR